MVSGIRIEREFLSSGSDIQTAYEQVTDRCSWSTPFHDLRWLQVLESIGERQCTLFVAFAGDDSAGAMAVMFRESDDFFFSPDFSMGTPYGGPLLVDSADTEAFEQLMAAVYQYTSAKCLTVFGAPGFKEFPVMSLPKSRDFRLTSHLGLSGDEENQFKRVHQKTRNMIRKAMKNGYTVKKGGIDLLDSFLPMVEDLVDRTGLRHHDRDSITQVLESFPGEARILIAVNREGDPESGGLFLFYRDRSYYWLSASHDGIPGMGQNALVQWEAILEARKRGCSVHDMVSIEPERLPNIALFKERFGGERESYPAYSMGSTSGRILRRLKRLAQHI